VKVFPLHASPRVYPIERVDPYLRESTFLEEARDRVLVLTDGDFSPKQEELIRDTVQRVTGKPALFHDWMHYDVTQPEGMEKATRYLVACIEHQRPGRILAFGERTAEMLCGEGTGWVERVTRPWVWLGQTPTFFFLREFTKVQKGLLDQELSWALHHNPDPAHSLKQRQYCQIENSQDAQACVEALHGRRVALDVETFGRLGSPNFKISTLALVDIDAPASPAWVWQEDFLQLDSPCRHALVQVLTNLSAVGGHNVKFDLRAISKALRLDPCRRPEVQVIDTYVWGRLIQANGPGNLDDLSFQVGEGGHKAEAQEELAKLIKVLRSLRTAAEKPVATAHAIQERTLANGRKQRRQVPTETRPPTPTERLNRIVTQWRTSAWGDSESMAGYGNMPSGDWLTAVDDTSSDPEVYVYGLMEPNLRARYCARDTVSTALLARHYEPLVEPYRELLDSHLARASWSIGKVEQRGLQVSVPEIQQFSDQLTRKSDELLAHILLYAPDLNPGSHKSLSEYLYSSLRTGGLDLAPISYTARGALSTDKDTLARLADQHPVIPLVQAWKEAEKLQSTYARGLLPHVDPDQRVRCSFNIMGAESGRMSCSSPNLQTLPSRGLYAKQAKRIYRASPGYQFLQFDYKTLEVRVAAMLSGDSAMIEIFKTGEDPHKRTAQLISDMVWKSPFETCGGLTGEALAEEQKRRRQVCKTINFALIYGSSTKSIAEAAGISDAEAELAKEIVLGRFSGLARWIRRTIYAAKQTGVAHTYWNGKKARARPLSAIYSTDKANVSRGERQAYNTPIQGTGHEYCLASGVQAVTWILNEGIDAYLVLLIHDSLFFEVAHHEIDAFVPEIKRIMTSHYTPHDVPLEVDVEIGPTWGDLRPYGTPAPSAQEGVAP
jgi:DNA polymerase I-like protein with 3'-5' exonuclease and polymerase domains